MKFSIQKNLLESALSNLNNFVNKKDDSQITSHVFIEAKDNALTLKATNFEISLISSIEANVKENGIATANASKLLNTIRSLQDGEVDFELENDNLNIKQKRSKFKFPTFSPNETFDFSDFEKGKKINIEPTSFINSLKKIQNVIDSNNHKMELNGALVDVKDYKINFVATNTKRLAIIELESQSVENLSFIIPKQSVAEITKLFFDEFEIHFLESELVIKNANYVFYTKLISGKFPDYAKIVPSEFKHILHINRDLMVDSIKRFSSLNEHLKLKFGTNEILFEVSGNRDERGEGGMEQDGVPAELSDFEIGINAKYILEFLANVESAEFEMCLNEVNAPFVVRSGNYFVINIPVIL